MVDLSRSEVLDGVWRRGNLQWKLDSLQRSITYTVRINPGANKICLLSSRQIGKSYWAVAYAIEFLIKNPGKIARIIAPTRGACEDIVNDNLSLIIQDSPEGMIRRVRSEMRWNLSNGSSLRIGALERAHVDGNRGGNASLIIYEECGFVKGDDFTYGVDSVIGPQLLRSKGTEIFVSSPPLDPDHPLVKKIKPECEVLGTFFQYSVFESPTITPEQIIICAERSGCLVTNDLADMIRDGIITAENIIAYAKVTGSILSESFMREFLALIIRSKIMTVVPNFIDGYPHIQSFDNPTHCWWQVVIDWGGVKDHTAALLQTYEYLSKTHLTRSECIFPPNTSTPDIVAGLREWEEKSGKNIAVRWADVPGQTQVDLKSLGYDINLPQKSDWLASVESMAAKYTQNRAIVHTDCHFTIKSLRSGMFNKAKTDFDRTEEIGHCDALAAMMYGFRMQNISSPYVYQNMSSNTFHAKHDTPSDQLLAEALSPRAFGKFKG